MAIKLSTARPEDYQHVRYVLKDHVLTLTIDRPAARNALNFAAYGELLGSFQHARESNDVRCIVVTGADPAFCSGDDVKEVMMGGGGQGPVMRDVRPRSPAQPILECERPVIAAVNGPAIGWGMELSLCADLRIASERARFGLLFVKRGLIPDVGTFTKLPSIVGNAKAAELMYTGDVIDANEALRIGLVCEVVPHDQLMTKAQALARKIADNAPLATRYIKEGLRRVSLPTQDMSVFTNGAYGVLFATEDHREGVRAFLEKREPKFEGK
jgi:enoyl-CoA hydratase/carnithine racemase